ncbi:barstar family protein [Bacillus badius]|uniref:barstar family protein n=1 Tax=Bacillus badius TaxID=1455 RepID=UPI0005972C6D|nr:barstar family protein [Bacillus badius]MED4718050.1 barstar family protein [Bacillus badius]
MTSAEFFLPQNSKFHIVSTKFIHEFDSLPYIKEREKELNIIKIDGNQCVNKRNLFNECRTQLNLPLYFSDNWDSLNDCINDLSWFPEKKGFLLIIRNGESLLRDQEDDLSIFLDLLHDTIQEWKKGRDYGDFVIPPTSFNVVLICKENFIEKLNEELLEINGSEFHINVG